MFFMFEYNSFFPWQPVTNIYFSCWLCFILCFCFSTIPFFHWNLCTIRNLFFRAFKQAVRMITFLSSFHCSALHFTNCTLLFISLHKPSDVGIPSLPNSLSVCPSICQVKQVFLTQIGLAYCCTDYSLFAPFFQSCLLQCGCRCLHGDWSKVCWLSQSGGL